MQRQNHGAKRRGAVCIDSGSPNRPAGANAKGSAKPNPLGQNPTRDNTEASRPSHVRPGGGIAMVDVGAKSVTERVARARAEVRMSVEAADGLRAATLAKGDAFTAAQIAGIFAAKQTAALIPLAHPLPLSSVEVVFAWAEPGLLHIEATARTNAQTGVEMEAMVAASVAALTIYDMTKSLEKGIAIESVRLLEKRGGKSGTWRATR